MSVGGSGFQPQIVASMPRKARGAGRTIGVQQQQKLELDSEGEFPPLPTFSKVNAPLANDSWAGIVKSTSGPRGGLGRGLKLTKAQKRAKNIWALINEHKTQLRKDERSLVLIPSSEGVAFK